MPGVERANGKGVTGAPRMRAPGRARHAALLAAARALLGERPIEAITLPAVAERAGIPTSSAYHFFKDISALLVELARTLAKQLAELDSPAGEYAQWTDLVRDTITAQAQFFNAEPAARALMLGPATTSAIKQAACYEDDRFGDALKTAVARQFVLPDTYPDQMFSKAIQISDIFFSLSAATHDAVTEGAQEEAADAVLAYLRLHLPARLPPVDDQPGSVS